MLCSLLSVLKYKSTRFSLSLSYLLALSSMKYIGVLDFIDFYKQKANYLMIILKIIIYLLCVFLRVGRHVCTHSSEHQPAGVCSHPILCLPGMELQSADLASDLSTHWAILMPIVMIFIHFIKLSNKNLVKLIWIIFSW